MTCEQCMADLSRWLDGELSPEQAEQMRRHIGDCAECAALYAAMQEIKEEGSAVSEGLPVPEKVGQAWRAAVYQDAAREADKKPLFAKARWPRFAAAAAGLVLVVGLSAALLNGGLPKMQNAAAPMESESLDTVLLRKSAGESGSYDLAFSDVPEAVYPTLAETPAPAAAPKAEALFGMAEEAEVAQESAPDAAPNGTLLEKRAWYTLSTQAFEGDAQRLKTVAEEMGGWIESQSQNGKAFDQNGAGRQLNMLLRVPSERMEEAMERLAEIGVLESSSVFAEDISERYYDTKGRLQNARALQTQYQALLERAEDVAVLAEITQKMSENQLQIDALQGTIQGMENRVAYSRIDVTLHETRNPTLAPAQSPSLGVRIRDGLIASLNGLLDFFAGLTVWLVAALPWIALLVLVALLVFFLWHRLRRR